MSKSYDVGVFQLDNGKWAYRYTFTINGKRYSRQSSKDEFGNPYKTKTAAIKARQKAINNNHNELKPKKPAPKSVKEIYLEYRNNSCSDKAYRTLQKQDSLWKNHLYKRFGNRFIDEITVSEINDYLSDLYYIDGYSYQYTESFLKMFYLILGQAYSRNYISTNFYNKLCINKNSKIHMPKKRSNDETNIVVFSNEELNILDNYFKNTNAETAYLLGRYCGLRINEAFGLKWGNVNLETGTIQIDRQMQYQEGLIKLVPLKTRNAKRIIYLNNIMREHLTKKMRQRLYNLKNNQSIILQNQRIIEDLDGSRIPSTELVNCLPNGKIQTVNSFKYPSREIKASLHIDFKYHYLRHTYGTMMAELNTPQHILCNQMGHGSIKVTQQYYIGTSERGIKILQTNLNHL